MQNDFEDPVTAAQVVVGATPVTLFSQGTVGQLIFFNTQVNLVNITLDRDGGNSITVPIPGKLAVKVKYLPFNRVSVNTGTISCLKILGGKVGRPGIEYVPFSFIQGMALGTNYTTTTAGAKLSTITVEDYGGNSYLPTYAEDAYFTASGAGALITTSPFLTPIPTSDPPLHLSKVFCDQIGISGPSTAVTVTILLLNATSVASPGNVAANA